MMRAHGSQEKRNAELRQALRTGHASNGNHSISLTPSKLLTPDADLCSPCSSNFQCYLRGVQVSYEDAAAKNAPCVQGEPTVNFYYHNSLCLSYARRSKQISDYGMWGYSVTTSRSINWYLNALWNEGWLLGRAHVDYLKKTFKRLHDGQKPLVDNKFIKGIVKDSDKERWLQL